MPGIKVTVRDGRAGRDPALVTEEGGEVLDRFERNPPPIEEGEQLTLPNGEVVKVIGVTNQVVMGEMTSSGGASIDSWDQTVIVGDLW